MVTLRDIAAQVGVSVPTVSLILSGKGERYRAETRAAVLRAADRLRYRADLTGRSLRVGRSYLIGALLFGVNAPLLSDFLRGVGEALAGQPFVPVVFSHDTAREEAEHLQRCEERRVDGYLANPSDLNNGRTAERLFRPILRRTAPLVEVFGRMLPGVPRVNVDMRGVGRLQVEHLHGLGHKQIVCLTHDRYDDALARPALHWDAWELCLGYRAAVRAYGGTPRVITHRVPSALPGPHGAADGWIAAGYAAAPSVLRLLARGTTAVICYNSLEAVGLVAALRDRDVDVPGACSVMGGCDSEAAVAVRPQLTCVGWPTVELGRRAASLLMAKMSGATAESVSLPGIVVERGSTGPTPGGRRLTRGGRRCI